MLLYITFAGDERHTCFVSHMTPRHHQRLPEGHTYSHGSRGQDICARLSTMTSHSPHGQTEASSDVTDIRQRMANLWMSRRDEIKECCHKVSTLKRVDFVLWISQYELLCSRLDCIYRCISFRIASSFYVTRVFWSFSPHKGVSTQWLIQQKYVLQLWFRPTFNWTCVPSVE